MELKIISPEGWIKVFVLAKPVTVIGSKPGSDIQLDSNIDFQISISDSKIQTTKLTLLSASDPDQQIKIFRNGITISPLLNYEVEIFPGDSLQFGKYTGLLENASIAQKSGLTTKRKTTTAWIWIVLFLCILLTASFLCLPKVHRLTSDLPNNTLIKGEVGNLIWETNLFTTDIRIESKDEQEVVGKKNSLGISPVEMTTYRLVAENWLSRLVNQPAEAEIIIKVVNAIPEISLESLKTGANEYLIHWQIEGDVEKATLTIDPFIEEIPAESFTGNRQISIQEDTDISIVAQNDGGTSEQFLSLAADPPEMQLVKFIVWTRSESRSQISDFAQEGNSSEFTEKFIEILPNDSSPAGYDLKQWQPARSLNPGEQIMLEWQVDHADTVLIDPLSDKFLAPVGAQFYYPEKTTNFTLSASANEQLNSYTLPIPVKKDQTQIASKAPEIEIFDAHPTTLQQPGKATLSWSVTGEWTRIQLISSANSVTYSSENATGVSGTLPATLSSGTVLADYLSPSGFLSLNLVEDTSFILKAWNGDLTDSSIVSVRVNPSAAVVRLQPIEVQITQLFSDSGKFQLGDTITVISELVRDNASEAAPTGTILISDGISSCVITLPRNSCDIKLRAVGDRVITARYSGNKDFLSAESTNKVTVEPVVLETVTLSASVFPENEIHTIDDEITVTAYLSAMPPENTAPTGSLFMTDGLTNCLLTLPRNSCDFDIRSAGQRTITINYSGDDQYNFASTNLLISSEAKVIPPTATPTVKPSSTPTITPTMTPTIPPRQIDLKIVGVYPQKSSYNIGDQIDIYIDPNYTSFLNQFPTEKIQVSDGFAACLFTIESGNHCSLRLIDAAATQIIASYPGDVVYSPAQSDPWPVNVKETPKIRTETEIFLVTPEQAKYRLGDQLTVSVNLTASQTAENPLSGTITVSDKFSTCEIVLPDQHACTLVLENGTANEITAVYSGDEIYASSTSAGYPIQISMMEVMANSIQAMKYTTCDIATPDTDNLIPLQIDTVENPPRNYFTLDDRFSVGSGFYLNASIQSLFGNLEPSPGTFTATICSLTDLSYCLNSSSANAVRDNVDFTRANAVLDFPAVNRTGHFSLTLTFTGDPALYGTESASYTIRDFKRGTLILTPYQVFDPNPEYTGYNWPDLPASELRATDYSFDAYLLKGGMNNCPVHLSSQEFSKPAGITLQVNIDPSIPGSDLSDSAWQTAVIANGYDQETVNRLQLNSSHWDQHTCLWENDGMNWTVHCSDVGLLESSEIRYALDYTDPNYQVADQNPNDGFSDHFITTQIEKPLTFFNAPKFSESLIANVPYWVNYRNASFAYFTAPECGDYDVIGYQTANNRIPSEQVLSIKTLVLSRAWMDSTFHFAEINDGYEIHYASEGNPLTRLPNYHGICGNCTNRPMMEFTYIPNEGCSQTTSGVLSVSPGEGTLFGGSYCENPYTTPDVRSSFCQLSFNNSGEIQLVYQGNDLVQGSVKTFALSIGSASGSAAMMSAESLTSGGNLQPSEHSANMNLTLQAEISDSQTAICNQTFPDCRNMFANQPYQLKIQPPMGTDGSRPFETIVIRWPAGIIEWHQNEGENLKPCSIDENNQTILFPADMDQACLFSLAEEISGLTKPITVTAVSSQYEIPEVTLYLPAELSKRNISLLPELSLRLNPTDESEPAEQIRDDLIENLYRSDNANPNSSTDPSAYAAYELKITATGFESGRNPLPGEKIVLKWSLLDEIRALTELPECTTPDEMGNYSLDIYSQPDGSWLAACAFWIPSTYDSDLPVSDLTIRLNSNFYEAEKRISVNEHPFLSDQAEFSRLPERKSASFITFSSIYSPGQPNVPLSAIRAGSEAAIDVFFSGYLETFDMESLKITLDGAPLETCFQAGTDQITCALPTDCQLPAGEYCPNDYVISGIYLGDERNEASQWITVSYRIE